MPAQQPRAHRTRTGWLCMLAVSWREALGVAREERGLPDVVQPSKQHDHALQAHAKAAMRESAELERVNVRLNAVERKLVRARTLCRMADVLSSKCITGISVFLLFVTEAF